MDRGAAKIEHRLGAVDRPTHTSTFHPIFHDVPVGTLDHAAGYGKSDCQVLVVMHSITVVLQVVSDPIGPASGDNGRVLRGGAFDGRPVYVRAAGRYLNLRPDIRYRSIGFRLARTYPLSPITSPAVDKPKPPAKAPKIEKGL